MSEFLGKRPLTRRHRDVLDLISLGYTDDEIARELEISPLTVKQHSKELVKRLGARNRPHAVYIALTEGVIS